MTILAAILVIGLIAAHMARPRFKRSALSAARFFSKLPPARRGTPKLRIANPLQSRPLWLQLPLWLLALGALLLLDARLKGTPSQGFGVWVAMDTSASMLTREGDQTRFDLALETLDDSLQNIRANSQQSCLRLSHFNQSLETLSQEEDDPNTLLSRARALRPQELGTDLRLIRNLANRLVTSPEADCTITHLLVISDQPPPEWIDSFEQLRIIWKVVGTPQTNVGFTEAQALRDPLSGLIRRIRIQVAAYGIQRNEVQLDITDPNQDTIFSETIRWEDGRFQGIFEPTTNGIYQLSLQTRDAYPLDDAIEIQVSRRQNIRVNWQHPDQQLPRQLGWERSAQNPQLIVTSGDDDQTYDQPTLFIGEAYTSASRLTRIGYFIEDHPMLQDLNFDAVERLKIQGTPLQPNFQPILMDTEGQVLLAYRQDPPAAYTPGLPITGDPNAEAVSATLFFNALRQLLDLQDPPPLYQLTNSQFPKAQGTRLALHPGEGNIALSGSDHGSLDNLKPVAIASSGPPIWPILVALAALFLLCERLLAFYRGDRWR